MSILDSNTTAKYLSSNKIVFKPALTDSQRQPNSVDLRLGFEFFVPKTWELGKAGREIVRVDIKDIADNYEKIVLKSGQYFEVAPGEMIIATTLERIELKTYDIMAVLYPRSSINRRGLAVDLTGIIDTGYCGNLMIPLKNKTQSQIIRIYPEERFVQLVFHTLMNPLTKNSCMKHGTRRPKYQQDKGESFKTFIPDKI